MRLDIWYAQWGSRMSLLHGCRLGRAAPAAFSAWLTCAMLLMPGCASPPAGNLTPINLAGVGSHDGSAFAAETTSGDAASADAAGTADGSAADTASAADVVTTPMAASIVAMATPTSAPVGAAIVISCVAVDADGATLALQPKGFSLVIAPPLEMVSAAAGLGLAVTSKKASVSAVRCALAAAELESGPVSLTFTPGDPAQIVAVVATSPIIAGDLGTAVHCAHRDSFGNPIDGKVAATIGGAASLSVINDGVKGAMVTATLAGSFAVWCVPASAALTSVNGEVVVVPAAPAFSKAVPTPATAKVDDAVAVACTAFDSYGNAVLSQPSPWKLVVDGGCVASGTQLQCTKAGTHVLTCEHAEVPVAVTAKVVIVAGKAVSLKLTLDPEQNNYSNGQVVGLIGEAVDKYGNAVIEPALDPITVKPAQQVELDVVNAQVAFGQDGLYSITVGLKGAPGLSATRQLRVDTSGPLINVSSPPRGSSKLWTPTTTVTYSVVDELSALGKVLFNGAFVPFTDGIGIASTLPLDHGVNLIDIKGYDQWDNVSSHVSAVIAAKKFVSAETSAGSAAQIDHGLAFWLGQQAIDSGVHVHSKPRDLATVMEIVLKNLDLSLMIGASFPVDVTGLKGTATVTGFSFGDANVNKGYPKITLVAKTGGLGLDGRIWNLDAKVNLKGKGIGFIPVNIDATVTAASMRVVGTVGIAVAAGKIKVETNYVAVTLESLDVNIDNGWGFLVNWLLDLFKGSITTLLEGIVEKQVKAAVDGPLGAALTDIAVQTVFNVPGFFGGPSVPVALATTPVAMTVYSASGSKNAGAWLRLRTSLTGKKTISHASLGAPMRWGCLGTKATTASFARSYPLEVAMHFDLANQLFAAIWQGGGLNLQLDGAALAGLDLSSYGVGKLTVDVDMHAAPLISDCTAGAQPQLQLADVQMDIKTTLKGKPMVVRAFLSAKADVAASKVTGPGGPEIGLDVLKIGTLETDVDQILVDGVVAPEGTVAFFEKLMPFLANVLINALQGTLASFPLPELDLSAMATSIPKGTVLAIDIQSVGSAPGHVHASGGVAK